MAEGDLYIECEGGDITADTSVLEILNALLVKTNTGKYGFRTVVTAAAAGDITPVLPCGAGVLAPLDVILRSVLVEADDGKPAIGLITHT